MGKHRTTARPRLCSALAGSALAAGLVGFATIGTAGIAQAADGPALVAGTPCTDDVSACVDLASGQAWLIEAGAVAHGPVRMSSGGPGHETPVGDFRVEWKNVNHHSKEFDGAPMPFAVFFAQGGIAFHEGNVDAPSAGCVRLANADASMFYDSLDVDDRVQVR